jgi:uncharacterized protein
MKQRVVIGAVLVLVLGMAIGFGGNALAGNDEPQPGGRTVAVSGTATVSTTPDEAVITLGVRSEAEESQGAFEQNASKMKAVLAAVTGEGVPKDDIETTNVSLDRQTKDRNTPREITIFVSRNEVDVTIRDLATVGTVIDAAVTAGVDEVRDIRFQISDETKVRREALQAAVRAARAKADAMAEAAGASITGVVSMREQGGSPEPQFERAVGFLAGASDQAIRTPVVAPDDILTRVTVTVVWRLG